MSGISGIQGVEWDAVELPSPVHGKLLLGVGRGAPHDAARRHRRAAAARAVRQDARGEEFPERHGHRSPARDRPVRHAPARRVRAGRPRAVDHAAGAARRGPARGRASCRARPTTVSWIPSRTSSPAAMRPATTATSGPKCCPPTPSASSRRRACCRRQRAPASASEVLARGGSRPALESFVAFRGRPPQLDALLRHNGMVASS